MDLFVEKYRPQTIEECILSSSLTETFNDMIETGVPQNVLLCGPAGTGKTSVARALCRDLDTPIHSRCTNIEFSIPSEEKPEIAKRFMNKLKNILEQEGVDYEENVLVKIILKYFPDFRRVLNEIQRYSVSGKIDVGILSNFDTIKINELIIAMKEKKFTECRQWVVSNLDNSPPELFRKIYETLYESLDKSSVPEAILILADYQYKSAFVADQEINFVACIVELMMRCTFK